MFNRENAFRLRKGMTIDEVETILGPHSGPIRRTKLAQYAWIGWMMMLRVWFLGPKRTLSKAIFDTPDAVERIVPLSRNGIDWYYHRSG